LTKHAKTKVIKKEPVPRKWTPSQLRIKRPPPDASMMVARELFPSNTKVASRELSPASKIQNAVMKAKITFISMFDIISNTFLKPE